MKEYYQNNSLPGPLHRFDKRAHYPFRQQCNTPTLDIVYRAVPVGTPIRRQLHQAVMSEAGTPPSTDIDVGAGVPKNPYVRELYVDATSSTPICKI